MSPFDPSQVRPFDVFAKVAERPADEGHAVGVGLGVRVGVRVVALDVARNQELGQDDKPGLGEAFNLMMDWLRFPLVTKGLAC